MGDGEVKVDAQYEHVRLQANLVNRGRRKGNGQTDHSQQRWIGLAAVRERVLRPEVAQYQNHLQRQMNKRKLASISYGKWWSVSSGQLLMTVDDKPRGDE